ncbi:MAG: hypothetical protein ACRDTI_10925 [Mycobacterium sp.]
MKWIEQLEDKLIAAIAEKVDQRIGATLDRIEARLVERLDDAIDRITDQIPGTLDDKLLDGLVGKMAARFPLLNGVIPASWLTNLLKGRP